MGQVYWCTRQQRLYTSKDSIFVTMRFHKFLKPISVSVNCLEGTFSVEYYFCNKGSVHHTETFAARFHDFSKLFSRNVAYLHQRILYSCVFTIFTSLFYPVSIYPFPFPYVSVEYWCDKGCVHQRIPCVFTSHSAYAATETELHAAKIDGLLPPNFL